MKNPSNHINIGWNNARSIQMEDIDLQTGMVLTGLKFTSWGSEHRLRLSAQGSRFHFVSGKMDPHTEGFLGQNLKLTRDNEFSVHEKMLPLKKSNDFVITNKNISFDISNLETDLGQNTIPFIDIQSVTTWTPSAMGGAGLIYKYPGENSKNSGYIGLKLKTYDFVPHISSDESKIYSNIKSFY